MSYLKKSNLVFACIGIVAAIAVWTSARIKSEQTTNEPLEVKLLNKTNTLKIVDGQKIGEGLRSTFEVVLLNESDKTVVAYTPLSDSSKSCARGVADPSLKTFIRWI